jgi:hypothetical protein
MVTDQQWLYELQPSQTGRPQYYSYDGVTTVRLYPSPTGNTLKLQTRGGVGDFADQETEYVALPGYRNALGAALAVRIAPLIVSSMPQYLLLEEARALRGIVQFDPAILNVSSYANGSNLSSRLLS